MNNTNKRWNGAGTIEAKNLLVLAPSFFQQIVESRMLGAIFIAVEKPSASGLPSLLLRYKNSTAALLIVKGNRAPAKVLPSPLIAGIPVGILPCNGEKGLQLWLNTLQRTQEFQTNVIGVLSMWKPFYLKWGTAFYRSLRQGFKGKPMRIKKWFADAVERKHLCDHISQGANLLIYAGHGRSRGWTGYRGLRWGHIIAAPLQEPVGTVITLTCSNLGVARNNRIPFGVQWVKSGRAAAFLGAVSGVYVEPLIEISNLLKAIFKKGELTTIGALMQQIDQEVKRKDEEALTECWNQFRLIGHPLELIWKP